MNGPQFRAARDNRIQRIGRSKKKLTTETNARTDPKPLKIECACGYTFVVAADGWSALLCPQCKTLITSASALARMFPPPETTESKG